MVRHMPRYVYMFMSARRGGRAGGKRTLGAEAVGGRRGGVRPGGRDWGPGTRGRRGWRGPREWGGWVSKCRKLIGFALADVWFLRLGELSGEELHGKKRITEHVRKIGLAILVLL